MSIAGLWPADSDRYHVFTIDYQTIPSLAERAKLLAKHPNGAKPTWEEIMREVGRTRCGSCLAPGGCWSSGRRGLRFVIIRH